MAENREFEEEFNLEQMERETEEMLKMRYLDRNNAEFKRTEGGFVSLRLGEEFYDKVLVYRTFPFTNPEIYISIREANEKAKEIGIIRDLRKDLESEAVEMLEEQMRLRYFTPQITKIKNIKVKYGFGYFEVITDHGACNFTIHMGGSSVVHLSDVRIIISDLDGNRFEIKDISKLSAREQKKIDVFL